MKRRTPLLIVMSALLAWSVALAAARAPFSVEEATAARIQEPASFWIDGRQEQTNDIVVVRITLERTSDFDPGATLEPVFVLGAAVGVLLNDPVLSSEALVAFPKTALVADARLMMMPGGNPSRITAERVERVLKVSGKNEWSRPVRLSKRKKEVVYPSLSSIGAGATTPQKGSRDKKN